MKKKIITLSILTLVSINSFAQSNGNTISSNGNGNTTSSTTSSNTTNNNTSTNSFALPSFGSLNNSTTTNQNGTTTQNTTNLPAVGSNATEVNKFIQDQKSKITNFEGNNYHDKNRQKIIDQTVNNLRTHAKFNPMAFCEIHKTVPTGNRKIHHYYKGQDACNGYPLCMDWMDVCDKDQNGVTSNWANFGGGKTGFGALSNKEKQIYDAHANPLNNYVQKNPTLFKDPSQIAQVAQSQELQKVSKENFSKVLSMNGVPLNQEVSSFCNQNMNEAMINTNNPSVKTFCPVTQKEKDVFDKVKQEAIQNGTWNPENTRIPRQYTTTPNQLNDRIYNVCADYGSYQAKVDPTVYRDICKHGTPGQFDPTKQDIRYGKVFQ